MKNKNESAETTKQTPGQINRNYAGSYSYTAPQQQGYSRGQRKTFEYTGHIYSLRWQGL